MYFLVSWLLALLLMPFLACGKACEGSLDVEDWWSFEGDDTGEEAPRFSARVHPDVPTMVVVRVVGPEDCAGFDARLEESGRTWAQSVDADCEVIFWGLGPSQEVRVEVVDGAGDSLGDTWLSLGALPAWVSEVDSDASDWGWTFTTRDGQPLILDPDGVPQWWLALPSPLVHFRDGWAYELHDPVARRVLPRADGSGVVVLVEGSSVTEWESTTTDTGLPDTGLPDTGAPDTGASDTGTPGGGVPEDQPGLLLELSWEGLGPELWWGTGLHDDVLIEEGEILAIGWWAEVEDGAEVLGDRLVGTNAFDGWTTHEAFPAELAEEPACRGLAWSPRQAHLAVSCPGVGAVALVDADGVGATAFLGADAWPVEDDRVLAVSDGRAPVRPGAVAWRDDRLVVLDHGEADDPARVVEVDLDLDEGTAVVVGELAGTGPLSTPGGVAVTEDGGTRVAWGDAGTVEQYDADGVRTGRVELGAPVGHLYVRQGVPFD